ncbi:MAG: aspartate aminotransferase family protein [Chthoniobacter sp.]|uniref:aspartate aminotransferase family protein n=1 Tax=Chthoniobacter sp. TaxID=2510640 RepID=UPI0032A62253
MLPEIITPIPGPRSRELAGKLRRHESQNVTYLAEDFPVFWQRAAGTNVWDADGNRYLDLTSAFGVSGLGHTNPQVRAALVAQSADLLHAMGDVHPTAVKTELCAQLSALTFERWGAGPGKVVLGNSGSDAIEAALKTSLLYTGNAGVIAFTGAYHGLGLGALSTVGIPFFREPFRTQLKEFATLLPYPFGPAGDMLRLRKELVATIQRRAIGCILVEPIQGRGGCVVPPAEFLPMLRTVCDEYGLLLVLDEIYTGFNRTGALFACEDSKVVPDIVCLGKALTGGFPLSACVGRADVMDAWPPSSGEALHTTTFLGNPLGCAMALAALAEHARPAVAAQVQASGQRLKSALEKMRSPHIWNVRGRGLMLGVELIKADGAPFTDLAIAIVTRALQDGLLLLADGPASNVLSITPPFSIDDEEIAFVAARLQEYLTALPGSIS